MHKLGVTCLSALLAVISGAFAGADASVSDEVSAQRHALMRRIDALSDTLPDHARQPDGPHLAQWYNWGKWPNGWGNWRNW